MDDAERQRQIDDAYRAIGQYIVRFSRLFHYMRFLMARRLTQGYPSPALGEIALGEHGHANISNAFFAMCRHVADLDEDEKKVERALRKRVSETNKTRTDYAHGDWTVGNAWAESEQILPPSFVRIRPRVGETTPEKVSEISVEELDEQSDEILALLHQVAVFGQVCLQPRINLPSAPPGINPISEGELRIRDVLMMQNDKVVPGPKWSWLQRPNS